MNNYIVSVLVAAFFAIPFSAQAVTVAELQAQIVQLSQLLNQLLAQKNLVQPSTTPPSLANCFVPTYDLYIGRTDADTNGEVKKLQLWLKAEGYFPDAQGTGYYGEKTAAAVMKWQKAHGMDFVTLTSGVGKQTRAKMQENCGKSVEAQCAKYDDPPVITSVMPASGPVGTKITVQGCNFLGFESDKNLWLKNSDGVKGVLHGERDGSNVVAKATIPVALCQTDTSYSGLACPSSLNLVPGTYSLQASSYGGMSNSLTFTVTAQ